MKILRHPLPIRVFHWLLVPALATEIVTGLYLSNPLPHRWPVEMRRVRKAHLSVGFALGTLYLGYLYARRKYPDLVPTAADLARLPRFLRYEAFLTHKKPQFFKYNPGQKLLYTLWLVLIPLLGSIGIILHSPHFFTRPVSLVGGLNRIRRLLYLGTVALTASIAVHIYFALTDSVCKLRSIFTGVYETALINRVRAWWGTLTAGGG
ncbi:MAG: cytochrome b/b6 domain-containing protein [Bacillota bacterium]|nr:cytochrome b/b6 domain-containing protein [Bacillota bacterium]